MSAGLPLGPPLACKGVRDQVGLDSSPWLRKKWRRWGGRGDSSKTKIRQYGEVSLFIVGLEHSDWIIADYRLETSRDQSYHVLALKLVYKTSLSDKFKCFVNMGPDFPNKTKTMLTLVRKIDIIIK